HSMLFHPSAAITDHFDAAAAFLEVTCGMDRPSAARRIASGARTLSADAVARMISADEASWMGWLGKFRASAMALKTAFDLPQSRRIPEASEWPAVRDLLLRELVPSTQIKVVNSDPHADDRPRFDPIEIEPGRWCAPPDMSTIFVSGNV